MAEFAGKVAVITGGARGQGRSHALAFARAGADIAICDACASYASVPYPLPDEADLDETAKLIRELGRRCVAVKADVTKAAEVEAFIDQAMTAYGRIDFLVANAGIWSVGGPMWEITESQFDETLAVDVKGVWLTCKYAIPKMLNQGGGSIVLTSSMAGAKGFPNVGHYVTAKHAVVGMMRTLANELAPYNIRVNAILPGMVNTPMIYFQEQYELFSPTDATREGYLETLERLMPMPGAFTEPEDQSNAVLWLCSDKSRLVSGIELPVAGGANASP